jgi:hypothetical protein
MTDFWDVAPFSLVDAHQRSSGANCLHHQGDVYGARGLVVAMVMEAANTSETSANFYHNTRRNVPGDK